MWWDLPPPLCPTCPNHISIFIFAKPYHFFLLSFSNFQIHIFFFFTFFVPRQIHIYSLEFIYTKSRCDKKCPFPQFLISFICFEIIILEFLQHDDWGQIDQIFSASYLGKHCQMLKIDVYPSYVPELILKNILSTVSRTFQNSIKSSFFQPHPNNQFFLLALDDWIN